MEELQTNGPAPAEERAEAPGTEGMPERSEAAEEISPSVRLRAAELAAQAKAIAGMGGADMLALMDTDAEVRAHVLRDGWDFVQAYHALEERAQTPPAVRGANGGLGGGMNVSAMTGREFARLNRMLGEGAVVPM